MSSLWAVINHGDRVDLEFTDLETGNSVTIGMRPDDIPALAEALLNTVPPTTGDTTP